jgi:hypothetical protein
MVFPEHKTIEQLIAERLAIRSKFIAEIPVGTKVENTYLDNHPTAITGPDGVYTDNESNEVNVFDIKDGEGHECGSGIWTAAFVRKVEDEPSK